MPEFERHIDIENLWTTMVEEARRDGSELPLLADFYHRNIVQHCNYGSALAYVLAEKMADNPSQVSQWQQLFESYMLANKAIGRAAAKDLLCQLQSNASIKDHYSPLLYFGGYQALQCYRLAHYCWLNNQRAMASYIQGRVVTLFGVDIHPGAVIGEGIFLDHAVGVVIGETAVVEDDVTLFQSVTLGGTGKGTGDRHPKVRRGAFIGSGAVIFGNIEIGENAKIAGGAVVVKSVEAGATVVGPIAKPIGTKNNKCEEL